MCFSFQRAFGITSFVKLFGKDKRIVLVNNFHSYIQISSILRTAASLDESKKSILTYLILTFL